MIDSGSAAVEGGDAIDNDDNAELSSEVKEDIFSRGANITFVVTTGGSVRVIVGNAVDVGDTEGEELVVVFVISNSISPPGITASCGHDKSETPSHNSFV